MKLKQRNKVRIVKCGHIEPSGVYDPKLESGYIIWDDTKTVGMHIPLSRAEGMAMNLHDPTWISKWNR